MLNPLVAIIVLTLVILGISVWAMVTQESDPTFNSESSASSWDTPDETAKPLVERKIGA